MKFVPIEPGEFRMGSRRDQIDQLIRRFPTTKTTDWWNGEQPQHSVEITRPFLLGVHEVTQGQYRAVTGKNPSRFNESEYLPVEQVSWSDAVGFCNKLSEREGRKPCYRITRNEVTIASGDGYRLPTEAEWEYACRAGTPVLYGFGDDDGALGEYAWHFPNSDRHTHAVGQKRPNQWGLHDMLGNVWEWCTDGYDVNYFSSSPAIDPPGAPRALNRVVRGGAFECFAGFCRPAFRGKFAPRDRHEFLGFRVVRVRE
jgi:formylglycine-generating enzyme required for sulfatase activity